MASGLLALLDDVSAIAKIAAQSLDDVAAAASRAGKKAAAIVVDDAAVTPSYALGFTPDRELPIVWRIARASLFNKLALLLPAALLISVFAAWLLTPLLMLGGLFLCFEGAEKLLSHLRGARGVPKPADLMLGSKALEDARVAGAVRTDLILSAEIMAIALAEVADLDLPLRAAALGLTAVGVTVAVYGAVAVILKMDDAGLALSRSTAVGARAVGRGLVRGAPLLLGALSAVGTAAMLWVGGDILLHGLKDYGVTAVAEFKATLKSPVVDVPLAGPVLVWAIGAALAAAVGFVAGVVVTPVMRIVKGRKTVASAAA